MYLFTRLCFFSLCVFSQIHPMARLTIHQLLLPTSPVVHPSTQPGELLTLRSFFAVS